MTSTPTNCAICNKAPAKHCTSSRSIAYCSVECQQTDWPLHKTICTKLRTLTRPSTSHKLAFLPPVESATPEPIWIPYRKMESDDEGGIPWEHADFGSFLGHPKTRIDMKGITHNFLRDFALDHTVRVVFRDGFAMDGSETNTSLVKATKGVMLHDWRGPVLVTRLPTTEIDPGFYEDVKAADLRIAVDYFTAYGDRSLLDPPASNASGRGQGNKVIGVKINCRGDQRLFGADIYSPTEVPHDHQVFTSGTSPPIPELLGSKLLVGKCPANKLWNEDYVDDDNLPAVYLNRNAYPKDRNEWGMSPPGWQNEVGSVIVVRADRKPITPKQIEALCYYCQFILSPVFEDSFGIGDVDRTPEEVMRDFLTEEAFRNWVAESGRE